MATLAHRCFVVGLGLLVMICIHPLVAQATVGWEIGDMVLDYGLDLEPGEERVLVDQEEVGHPFFMEFSWKLNADHCRLHVQESTSQGAAGKATVVKDDGLFNGVVSHAVHQNVVAVVVKTAEGKPCSINPSQDEFLVLAPEPRAPASVQEEMASAPIGAVVVVFRATTFYLPQNVTVKPGEKVVWVYADGAQEPHSVTSGSCNVNDCSGGGQQFNSGLSLNKPGQRFEHVFTHSGAFPYHCDLHLGSMQGSVTVQGSP